MENAQSESRVETWIKEHLWLFAIVAGLLVFLSLAGPILTSKGVSATYVEAGADSYWEFAKSSNRADVSAGQIFRSWPFVCIYCLTLVGVGFSVAGHWRKNFYAASLLVFLCVGILFFTGTSLYDFTSCYALIGGQTGDYLKDYSEVASTKLSFGCAFGGAFSFVAALLSLAASNSADSFNVYDISEIGILSGMAIALQFIKIQIGQTGGSINLGLIPLFIISLRHGPMKGFIASAFIFGLVTCLTDGYGFFTYPLDYLVGFGSCAALGLFSKLIFRSDKEKVWTPMGFVWIAVGCILATLVRFMGSTASSMVNYGLGFKAALIYNAIYIPVTGAVSLGAMEALYLPLARLQKQFPAKSSAGR